MAWLKPAGTTANGITIQINPGNSVSSNQRCWTHRWTCRPCTKNYDTNLTSPDVLGRADALLNKPKRREHQPPTSQAPTPPVRNKRKPALSPMENAAKQDTTPKIGTIFQKDSQHVLSHHKPHWTLNTATFVIVIIYLLETNNYYLGVQFWKMEYQVMELFISQESCMCLYVLWPLWILWWLQ